MEITDPKDLLVAVPDVKNSTVTTAAKKLEDVGLEKLRYADAKLASGKATAQQPAAGSKVRPGSVVEVTFEAGAKPPVVKSDARKR